MADPPKPTLDDLRRIAHADTLPLLERGDPGVRGALEAQWLAANPPPEPDTKSTPPEDPAMVRLADEVERQQRDASEALEQALRTTLSKKYNATTAVDSSVGIPPVMHPVPSERYERQDRIRRAIESGGRPDPKDVADEWEEEERYQQELRTEFMRRPYEQPAAYTSVFKHSPEETKQAQHTSHTEWLWGATGVVITIAAIVFWGLLYVFAAALYAVGIYRAPWFRSKSKQARVIGKSGIFAGIVLVLFGFWWFVPQPDFAKAVREAFRPESSPISTPQVAVSMPTPTPSPIAAQLERPKPAALPSGSPASSAPSIPAQAPAQQLPTLGEPLVVLLSLRLYVHVVGWESEDRSIKGLRLLPGARVAVRSEKTQTVVFRGVTDPFSGVGIELQPGIYEFIVEYDGYKTAHQKVTISSSDKSNKIQIDLFALGFGRP